MEQTTINIFTEEEQSILNKIREYIETNKDTIKNDYKDKFICCCYDNEQGEIKVTDIKQDCPIIGAYMLYDVNNDYIFQKCNIKEDLTGCMENGLIYTINSKDDSLINTITYLKNNLTDQQVNEENKIYSTKIDKTNNSKEITFYTTHSILGGLSKDITIEIDTNGIESLKSEDLTEEDKKKLSDTLLSDMINGGLLLQIFTRNGCLLLEKICHNQLNTKENILSKTNSTFLRKIEEKTINGVINYIENPNTGGEFIIYNKNDNIQETNKLGTLYLYQGKLYIVNDNNNNTQNITLLNTNTLEDLENLKNTYDIYYIDKETPDKLQSVSIENENNIQIDKGVVLSFDKIDLNNPNSKLYLSGIYDGEFKEVTKEITDPETKKTTTKTKKELVNGDGWCYDKNMGNHESSLYKNTIKDNEEYQFECFNNIILKKDKINKKNNFKNTINFQNNIIIQYGQFKDNCFYSGSAYLRDNPTGKSIEELNDEQINPDKKIYTLERDEENLDKRIITYYGKAIGLEDDIKLQMTVGKDNIVTLRVIKNGEILTDAQKIKEIINKLKQFFNNIPIEQLDNFDDCLATLYYTTIMNKEEYKDTNILIVDKYECIKNIRKYNEVRMYMINQTIDIINKIPQDKRKGKYIIPCGWLKIMHQVNLRIDFDNKICEIVNTGGYAFVDETVINNLQTALREQLKGENWVVCENNTMCQSTGNCIIASNIVATEKTVIENKVKEYNKKIKQLEEVDKEIKNIKQQPKSVTNLRSRFTNQIKIQELENKIQELQKEKQKITGSINKLDKINNKAEQQEQELQLLQQNKISTDNKIKELQNELEQKLQRLEEQKQNLQKELQESLNTIINNNNKDTQQTITVEKLEQQVQSLSNKYNDKIEQIVINEILYNDLRKKVEELKKEKQGQIITEELLKKEVLQKQSIEDRIEEIKQDTERLKIEKENFVRYNLISKERLFNECGNQFNEELSNNVIESGYGLRIV